MSAEQAAPSARAHVLIVDDDPRFLTAIARLLKAEHKVSTEADPSKVMERLAGADQYDLILCDMTMPDIGGPDVYRLVSEVAPQYLSKLVFFTGGAVTTEAATFLGREGITSMSKYLSPASLREEVARHVARLARPTS